MSIPPEKMAELYWSKLRRQAIWEIEGILKRMEHASDGTLTYWLTVRGHLRER